MAQTWSGGHSAPVLCVQSAGGAAGVLASGAEGGEVTVWSPEGTPIAQLRLPGGDDVTCAAFSPAAPGLLYVSHGEAVSVLDPRKLKEPVEHLSGVGEDEINGLSFNDTGSMLAAGDDSGAVRIVEVQSGKVVRTLRKHTNICSSVAFRPQRPQSLVSAGLDMQVMLWSLQKTRPLWSVSLQDSQEAVGRPGQLFNPPLVHCVTASSCGNLLACGAEDGRLHLLRVGAGSRVDHQVALQAHSQGASQAHFLSFLSHPYWLLSAGNDGVVALWDASAHAELPPEAKASNSSRAPASRRRARGKPKGARAPPRAHHQGAPQQQEPHAAGPHRETAGEGVCEGAEASVCEGAEASVCEGAEASVCEGAEASVCEAGPGTEERPVPALSFTHTDKVNWVCPALLQGRPSVVVADQSADLHVYPLILDL
ncbi:WD repeat-containing protein 53 [Sardina pilchardus]|uniref:WD repeat-containing protein 53 n=1 Tax=Sardina pilchardus TaxID=27697 RepID=UPI002E0DC49A